MLGETRGAVPRPVAAGASTRRDDDGTADGGDSQLPHRTHRDPTLLPTYFHAQGHFGPQRWTLHWITGMYDHISLSKI